jgi:peroxiredoxin
MAAHRNRQLLNAGSRAPGFRLARLGGGEAGLGGLISAGPVLLAFFKITCPVCQLTLPFLDRLHAPGTLAVYGISQNGPEDTEEFARDYGLRFPMLLDTEESGFPASNAYGISAVPSMFLVETDGVVSRVMEGWSRREIEWLGARIGIAAIPPGERVPDWKAG